jgi:sensor domain CHASE-containing protein
VGCAIASGRGSLSAGVLLKAFDGWSTGLLVLGMLVTGVSFVALLVRFSEADEAAVKAEAELIVASPLAVS